MIKRYLIFFLYKRRRKKELNSLKFGLEKNEYFLISYPKSGNTWLRVILSNLLKKNKNLRIGLHNVHQYVPDSHIKTQRTSIIEKKSEFNNLKIKIVKSHDRFKPFFKKKKVIYITRNLLDVTPSYFFYLKARKTTQPKIDEVISGKANNSFGSWFNHNKFWLKSKKHNILIIRYERLKSDPEQEIKSICDFIGLESNSQEINNAIKNSDLNSMKDLEKEHGYYNDTRTASGKSMNFVGYKQDVSTLLNLTQRKKIHKEQKKIDEIIKKFKSRNNEPK